MCCVNPYVATVEKVPTTQILPDDTKSTEENSPEIESVLVKVPSATTQRPGSDTAVAQLETLVEQYSFTRTPSLENRAQSVSSEDITEALLVCEDMSTEKTSGITRKEPHEMAAIVVSSHSTLSGPNTAVTVKSNERLRSPALSPKSSYISGKMF